MRMSANSTQPNFSEGFFLPKSPGNIYLDGLAIALQNSPEWIQDDIDTLTAAIEGHTKALAEAEIELAERKETLKNLYARKENDRRKSDAANVTEFEFVARIIEPTITLHQEPLGVYGFWCEWKGGSTSESHATAQDAWRAAFNELDRRANGGAL
jgi:hypothetical protein